MSQPGFDGGNQSVEGWEVTIVRFVVLDIFPELLNRVVVGRVGWQWIDRQSLGLPSAVRARLLRGMVLSALVDQDERLLRPGQHLGEKVAITLCGEAALMTVIEQAPAEVIDQPKDFVGFTLATALDYRLLAKRSPGPRQRTPLCETGFVGKQQQRAARCLASATICGHSCSTQRLRFATSK